LTSQRAPIHVQNWSVAVALFVLAVNDDGVRMRSPARFRLREKTKFSFLRIRLIRLIRVIAVAAAFPAFFCASASPSRLSAMRRTPRQRWRPNNVGNGLWSPCSNTNNQWTVTAV